MKPIIISLVLLLLSVTLFSQTNLDDEREILNWLGEWKGELNIESTSKSKQVVPMKIKHFKTDTIGTYGWFLIYGEDEKNGKRAYFLKEKDPSNGHYLLDEKNGILLDTYLAGNKMISSYHVEGTLITSIYTLKPDGNMLFEIYFGNTDQVNTSGGNEDIPIVKSYKVGGYQRAELKRVGEGDKN
jgi:hypothetical protein